MKNWYQEIEEQLHSTLNEHLPNHRLAEVLNYATFPAGKLFRSHIVYAVAQDLGNFTKDHQILASSIELHHTYSLVHDDLPAMDNDDIRRGKPSTHKKYNDWMAILAGDSLLAVSFSNLCKVSPNKLPWLLKFFGFCTASKGLILGQCLDMEGSSNTSLQHLLTTHKLKTSRLIQLAVVGSTYLAKDLNLVDYKKMMRLGNAIGLSFQLLDDYQELSDELGAHEREVNPFLRYGHNKITKIVQDLQQNAEDLCDNYNLKALKDIIKEHYQKFDL